MGWGVCCKNYAKDPKQLGGTYPKLAIVDLVSCSTNQSLNLSRAFVQQISGLVSPGGLPSDPPILILIIFLGEICFPSWLVECCTLQHFLTKCTYFTSPSTSSPFVFNIHRMSSQHPQQHQQLPPQGAKDPKRNRGRSCHTNILSITSRLWSKATRRR